MLYKWIVLILAGFILWKLFRGDLRFKKKPEAPQPEPEQVYSPGEMVRDPICGSFVPANSDIRVRNGNHVYCFCSYECRDDYLKQLEAGQQPRT